MKSIRLSLIVYFLALLAAAEAAAFWFVSRSYVATLHEKQEADQQLLRNQFSEYTRGERLKFDQELLDQAKEVAVLAALQTQWQRLHPTRLLALGMMSEAQAHLGGPIWISEQAPSRPGVESLRGILINKLLTEVSLSEDYLPKSPTGDPEYYQVNTEWVAKPWRSKSLAGETLPLVGIELNPASSPFLDAYQVFDDQTLATGRPVRRVMLRVSVSPNRIFRGRAPGDGGRAGGGRQQRGANPAPAAAPAPAVAGPPRWTEPSPPWMVIHAAREPISLAATLSALDGQLQDALSQQEDEAAASLVALRRRMLFVGFSTFLATMVGGLVLISYGLAPLGRLTDAVSRVSARDFQLPLDKGESLPSELVPIRDRLQATLDSLRRAFEREKQAAADISHELRTPVASLLTTVEVALRKPREAREYRTTLEEVRGISRQMRHLVERLMALARLDAGSDRPRRRDVDVGELVQESIALVRPLAAERGLELRVHCPKPVTVTTDPDKLREVLVNLLHNAVQYNRPHGSVDVSAEAADGWLDLSVHDTGIGIRPEASEHIFERFYRADASRHADDLHAGLGLSIVKGYVGLLGGSISVESREGQGSTFRVRLPAA